MIRYRLKPLHKRGPMFKITIGRGQHGLDAYRMLERLIGYGRAASAMVIHGECADTQVLTPRVPRARRARPRLKSQIHETVFRTKNKLVRLPIWRHHEIGVSECIGHGPEHWEARVVPRLISRLAR